MDQAGAQHSQSPMDAGYGAVMGKISSVRYLTQGNMHRPPRLVTAFKPKLQADLLTCPVQQFDDADGRQQHHLPVRGRGLSLDRMRVLQGNGLGAVQDAP